MEEIDLLVSGEGIGAGKDYHETSVAVEAAWRQMETNDFESAFRGFRDASGKLEVILETVRSLAQRRAALREQVNEAEARALRALENARGLWQLPEEEIEQQHKLLLKSKALAARNALAKALDELTCIRRTLEESGRVQTALRSQVAEAETRAMKAFEVW
ncbi:MAG: hypothetical protein WAO20_05510, partial [Acidobacteriota bacterium]